MAPSKAQEALKFAKKRAETAKGWIDLHNAVFGIGGKLGELFPTQSERVEFSKTPEFAEIQELISSFGDKRGKANEEFGDMLSKSNGKILVRVPKSIHAALLVEAEAEGVSLNQLILAKIAVQLRSVA